MAALDMESKNKWQSSTSEAKEQQNVVVVTIISTVSTEFLHF